MDSWFGFHTERLARRVTFAARRPQRHPAGTTAAPRPAVTAPAARVRRRTTLLPAGALAAGVTALAALQIPAAAADIAAALGRLLAARDVWLPRRDMFGLVLASTGLGRLLPVGPRRRRYGSSASTAAAASAALSACGPC
jgi:hypothetical protein